MQSQTFSTDELRAKARWIRDDLEENIVQSKTKTLDPDTVLKLYNFLQRLSYLQQCPPLESIRISAIHRAVLSITDNENDTRWPDKLIEICNRIVARWENEYGNLNDIHIDLFGPGGRLRGIAEPHESNRRALVERWTIGPGPTISLLRAFEHGHLDFTPGQHVIAALQVTPRPLTVYRYRWWIHPIFAFHDGIISAPGASGGISFDSEGAYAITLTEIDTMDTSAAIETFVYRTRPTDPGRFRLINSFLPVKTPIRILRTHTLDSKWSPIAGIRYDGLYKITDWSARGESSVKGGRSSEWIFDLTLRREAHQTPVGTVIMHPTAEELDDYKEYRRIREAYARANAEHRTISTPSALTEMQQRQLHHPSPRRAGIVEASSSLSNGDLAAAVADSLVVTPPMVRRVSRSEPAFNIPEHFDEGDDAASNDDRGSFVLVSEEHDNPLLNLIRPSVSSPTGEGIEEHESAELTGLKAFAFPVERKTTVGGLHIVRRGLRNPDAEDQ